MKMNNAQHTENWLRACGKEVGLKNASTQLGCILEEVAELLNELYVNEISTSEQITDALSALTKLAATFKRGEDRLQGRGDSESIVDALADIKVTVDGFAYLAGLDIQKADAITIEANNRKLIDGKPVILDGGKIGKPAGWIAPDYSECVHNSLFG